MIWNKHHNLRAIARNEAISVLVVLS